MTENDDKMENWNTFTSLRINFKKENVRKMIPAT